MRWCLWLYVFRRMCFQAFLQWFFGNSSRDSFTILYNWSFVNFSGVSIRNLAKYSVGNSRWNVSKNIFWWCSQHLHNFIFSAPSRKSSRNRYWDAIKYSFIYFIRKTSKICSKNASNNYSMELIRIVATNNYYECLHKYD